MQVRKTNLRSSRRIPRQKKRKPPPAIVRARQRPFIKAGLPTMMKSNIEGSFQLDFPASTYNYSIGGSLDYFIEKVRNDLTYLYQKFAEPDTEEPVVTKPVTDPEFSTKFTTLGWKQLALRPKFRINGKKRKTMRELTLPSHIRGKACNEDYLNNNHANNLNVLEYKVYSQLEPGYSSFEGKPLENAFIMKQILDEDITDYFAIQLLNWDNYDFDDSENRTKFNDRLKTSLYNAMMKVLIPWGEGKTASETYTYINKEQFGICLISTFDNLIDKAWERIENGYNYDDQVSTSGSSASGGMKALKLRAPKPEYKNLYDYLCFRLEPHHDFHGERVTLKTKSKGAITKKNNEKAYKVLKKTAEEYDKKSKFNIDDFTNSYVSGSFGNLEEEFSSYDEFTNLLKIMSKIKASQNSVTLSFNEAVDVKITKDSLDRVWAKGLSGQDLALHELIEEVAKLISGRSIYRDAGGSVFLGRITELKSAFSSGTDIGNLIEKIESSTEFAERLFDGAGQSSLSKNDLIKVDYYGISTQSPNGKVFNAPEEIEVNKYINPNNVANMFTYIIIKPSIAKGDMINKDREISYTVKLPVKREKTDRVWDVIELTFDSVVYDLSLLIRYYLSIRDVTEDQAVSLKQFSAVDFKKQCNDMIWVLLNLKRMGDHGQAERAKADNGIFESGDQLAAAYGMMINVPTIVTYSRKGFGNHFILYGAELKLDVLKKMIAQYLGNIPNNYNDLKMNIEDKLRTDDINIAKKILTLVSGVAKLKEVFAVSDARGDKKTVTFTTVIQTIVGSFEKMNTELLGSASRESAKILLKTLPWKTLFSLFSGGKKKLKSDIEIMVNTFMLLINILGEMYQFAKDLELIDSVKQYIIDVLKPLIPIGEDRIYLTNIQENIKYIIGKLKEEKSDTSKFQGLNLYVERFFVDIRSHAELEFTDILNPIKNFIIKVETITSTEIDDNNIEATLNKFNAINVPTTSQESRP
jgi:hypothetical protein